MGFKINFGQIASGAMQQYLKDDDARIAGASKKREKNDERKFELKKLSIQNDYKLGQQRQKAKLDGLKASAVNHIDPDFAYPIGREWHSTAKEFNFSVLDPNKDISQRSAVGKTPLRRVTWLEDNIGRLFKDDNKLLKQKPKFAQHLLEQATFYIDSGGILGQRTNAAGEPIDGQYLEGSFNNIFKLATLSENNNFGAAGQSYFNLFKKTRPRQYTSPNPKIENHLKRLERNSSRTGNKDYIPKSILYNNLAFIESSTDEGFAILQPKVFGLRGMISPDPSSAYNIGKEALVASLANKSIVSPSVYSGKDSNGHNIETDIIDIISSVMLITTPFPRPITPESGRLRFFPQTPKSYQDAAAKRAEMKPDSKKLLTHTTRLLQLSEEMEKLRSARATPVDRVLGLQALRPIWTSLSAAVKSFGFTSGDSNSVITDGFSKTYGTRMVGSINANLQDGSPQNNNIRASMDSAFNRFDNRLNALKEAQTKGGGLDNYEKVTDDIIAKEIEYAYLKIQTIFHIAKLIQGGTGGRGVSNMDFENVAKSLSEGTLSTLGTQRIAYKALHKQAVKGYVEHIVGSNPEMKPNGPFAITIENKILDVYGRSKEVMQRKQAANDATIDHPTKQDETLQERNDEIQRLRNANPTWTLKEATDAYDKSRNPSDEELQFGEM